MSFSTRRATIGGVLVGVGLILTLTEGMRFWGLITLFSAAVVLFLTFYKPFK